MTEIPKNTPGIPQQQTQRIEQIKPETVQEPVAADVVENQAKEITEIPENPADRSTVKVDNLENDIKIYTSNPALAAKALEIAELAEKKYLQDNIQDAELKALNVGKAFIEEFQK